VILKTGAEGSCPSRPFLTAAYSPDRGAPYLSMANNRHLHDAEVDPAHRFLALPHQFNSSGVAYR